MPKKNKRPVVRIKRHHLDQLLESTGTGFFSVTFRKKPEPGHALGEVRTLLTRNGVKKDVKGTGSPLPPGSTVRRQYDMQKHSWRSFDKDRVMEVRAHEKIYKVED